jgi:release factor glutamine methyltransferase
MMAEMDIAEFGQIRLALCDKVYSPAEDSLLLAKALEGVRGRSCLEIGCGTGLISIFLARNGNGVIATDINPFAVECTIRNARDNGVNIEVRHTDLFKGIKGEFDLIIFNPPYLPSKKEDRGEKWHDLALDGGSDGLSQTRRFIKEAPKRLRKGGALYTLVSSLSPKGSVDSMLEGFRVTVPGSFKHFFETVSVLRLEPEEKV